MESGEGALLEAADGNNDSRGEAEGAVGDVARRISFLFTGSVFPSSLKNCQ